MEKVGYSTIDEVINDFLQVLSSDYKEKIKEMSIDDFCTIEHFNFGLWIRNKYFYQNPSNEQLVKNIINPNDYMFLDYNEFSHTILEKLYEKITTEKK